MDVCKNHKFLAPDHFCPFANTDKENHGSTQLAPTPAEPKVLSMRLHCVPYINMVLLMDGHLNFWNNYNIGARY